MHLNELEPSKYAKKLVEYLGDPEKVLEQARADYEWKIMNWLMMPEPDLM